MEEWNESGEQTQPAEATLFCAFVCACMCSRMHSRNEKILIYGNQTGTKLNGKFSCIFQRQRQHSTERSTACQQLKIRMCAWLVVCVARTILFHSERVTPCNCFFLVRRHTHVVVVIQFACIHAHAHTHCFGCLSVSSLRYACPFGANRLTVNMKPDAHPLRLQFPQAPMSRQRSHIDNHRNPRTKSQAITKSMREDRRNGLAVSHFPNIINWNVEW